jgi:hypothetical protein
MIEITQFTTTNHIVNILEPFDSSCVVSFVTHHASDSLRSVTRVRVPPIISLQHAHHRGNSQSISMVVDQSTFALYSFAFQTEIEP